MPEPLLAAAAVADLTPEPAVGTFLAGFAPNRRATGLLDPLEAGALVLEVQGERLALVTVDSIGLMRDTVASIRGAVHEVLAERVLVCSTHSHSTPDTMGLWGPTILGFLPVKTGVDPAYIDRLVARIAAAVDTAARRLRPARLRAATFPVDPRWTRNDRSEGGRDDGAVALSLDTPEGERIATLLNYASHPETLWEKNRLVSADYPGAFRRRLRESVPGVPLFFQGNLGGMLTPNTPPTPSQDERQAFLSTMGAALADATTAALLDAPEIPVEHLEHRRAEVAVPAANWRFRLMHRVGLLARPIERGVAHTEVNRVRLGPVTIATFPGEALPEVGLAIKAKLPGEHRLLCCLGCDEIGYVLEPGMFARKHYAYEQTMSMGPDTAPLLTAALVDLDAGAA